MIRLTLAALALLAGCANVTFPSELGPGPVPKAQAVEAWTPPRLNPAGAPDGAPCVYASACRSAYCAGGVCQHSDVEDAAAVARR